MSSPSAGATPPARAERRPTGLADLLLAPFLRDAVVARVERLSARFVEATLAGPGLQGAAWLPGQKVQIAFGGLKSRTYTPVGWDTVRGRTRLVGYAHGVGPGSEWLAGLREGDALRLMGPRRSLDLSSAGPRTLLCGDETSFALAAAALLRGEHCVFEVDSVAESRPVLAALGIDGAALVERLPGDAHLDALLAVAWGLRERAELQDGVLTGKSTTIQRLLRHLRRDGGLAPSALRTKAYWAPGKTGLD